MRAFFACMPACLRTRLPTRLHHTVPAHQCPRVHAHTVRQTSMRARAYIHAHMGASM